MVYAYRKRRCLVWRNGAQRVLRYQLDLHVCNAWNTHGARRRHDARLPVAVDKPIPRHDPRPVRGRHAVRRGHGAVVEHGDVLARRRGVGEVQHRGFNAHAGHVHDSADGQALGAPVGKGHSELSVDLDAVRRLRELPGLVLRLQAKRPRQRDHVRDGLARPQRDVDVVAVRRRRDCERGGDVGAKLKGKLFIVCEGYLAAERRHVIRWGPAEALGQVKDLLGVRRQPWCYGLGVDVDLQRDRQLCLVAFNLLPAACHEGVAPLALVVEPVLAQLRVPHALHEGLLLGVARRPHALVFRGGCVVAVVMVRGGRVRVNVVLQGARRNVRTAERQTVDLEAVLRDLGVSVRDLDLAQRSVLHVELLEQVRRCGLVLYDLGHELDAAGVLAGLHGVVLQRHRAALQSLEREVSGVDLERRRAVRRLLEAEVETYRVPARADRGLVVDVQGAVEGVPLGEQLGCHVKVARGSVYNPQRLDRCDARVEHLWGDAHLRHPVVLIVGEHEADDVPLDNQRLHLATHRYRQTHHRQVLAAEHERVLEREG
eukprot:PhM_4_TR15633/c0_g1_i1/m.78224